MYKRPKKYMRGRFRALKRKALKRKKKGGESSRLFDERKEGTEEIWKPCPIRGYEVSNLGRVRSKFRTVYNKGSRKMYFQEGQILTAGLEDGYPFVKLMRHGRGRKYYIHQLVAYAFLGPNPDTSKYTVDHISRCRDDNRPENLRYATSSQQNKNRDMSHIVGEKTSNSRLNDETVRAIRREREEGATLRALSEKYEVGKTTISDLVLRKTWTHI